MSLRARRFLRFAGGVLAAELVGCASAPDPYSVGRPVAPALPTAVAKRAAVAPPPGRPGAVVPAGASAPAEPGVPDVLRAADAVRFALENNPALAAVREQRGFARGAAVIAKTYPYNPLLQVFELGDNGPASAGVTNHAFTEVTMRLDLEVRGQGKHRQAAARAGLTRTEWEIATQELLVSVAATRAFNAVVYRQRKLDVLEDTIRFNERVLDQVKKLADLGRLRSADLIVARTELDAARAALGQGKTALALARADLRRQFGTLDDAFAVKGELDLAAPAPDFDAFARAALELRPDLQTRRAMAEEAQARLRLQVADRYGNPSIGPGFEYNETRATFVGVWLVTPIPVLNTRRGEIMQAEATAARSRAEVRQFEVQSAQDVQAALARLAAARKWADSYSAEVLPNLRKAVEDTNRLFEQNDPGLDVLRVLSVQRNYLRAFDAYLDALFELSQARADLAAAVGDPNLAFALPPPPAGLTPGANPPKKDQP